MHPERQNFFNPQSAAWQLQQIPLQDLNFNAIYTVPVGVVSFCPRVAGIAITKDWQLGWFANYQSGQFLAPPVSTTLNFFQSEDIRVAGQPLYRQGVNINDQSRFSPSTTQVLNPTAWEPCPSQCGLCVNFGVLQRFPRSADTRPRTRTSAAISGLAPEGKFNLFIRAEFVNIFNRTLFPNPSTANPQNPAGRIERQSIAAASESSIPTCRPVRIYGTTPYLQGRTGTLVARFSF